MKTIKSGNIYKRKGEKGDDRWWDRMVCIVGDSNVLYSQRFDKDFDNINCVSCSIDQFKKIMDISNPITE